MKSPWLQKWMYAHYRAPELWSEPWLHSPRAKYFFEAFFLSKKLKKNVFMFHIRILKCVCVCVLTQSCLTLCDPMDYITHQAPLSMGFSRQEYWNRLLCPPPGYIPDPGIELRSLALQAESLSSEPPRNPK